MRDIDTTSSGAEQQFALVTGPAIVDSVTMNQPDGGVPNTGLHLSVADYNALVTLSFDQLSRRAIVVRQAPALIVVR